MWTFWSVYLETMQTVLRKRVSHQAEKEAPGQNTQYMVIALNHITCPKVSPMATGLQNYNYWSFMLAVMALLSGFTLSPLEECLRYIVLTQRRFIWVHSILCVARGCGLCNSLLWTQAAIQEREFLLDNWAAAFRKYIVLMILGLPGYK